MTEEIDVDKEINDEWDKFRAYIKKNYPDDFNKILRMCNEYGLLPKQLFEQGYRSGFRYVTSLVTDSLVDEKILEVVEVAPGEYRDKKWIN
tara:strand:+ start:381 stop:653 length:273 start_codon:yes stop_codon:yes gene_type:complete